MTTPSEPWFSISPADDGLLTCAACHERMDTRLDFLDHHPGWCPKCGAESAYLTWKSRAIQVVPSKAPPVFATFLRWAQDNLDELDYVELMVAFEEIADALNGQRSAVSEDRAPSQLPSSLTTDH